MTHRRQRWGTRKWGGIGLAALAVIASLVAASALGLTTPRTSHLVAHGTPLPLPSLAPPSPPPSATPVPSAAGSAPAGPTTLMSVGPNEIAAFDSTAAATSTLGGTWLPIPVPSGASGLVVDRGDPDFLAVGGSKVQMTGDGGRHWAATHTQPAAAGPFVPLLISPWDSRVLFVSHGGQVAVTTDGGAAWHDVGVPKGQPVMATGNSPGTFFVLVGGNAFQLVDNGAHVNDRPPLPKGVTTTSLAVGLFRLVVCCSGHHPLILQGTKWSEAPITAVGPMAVLGTDIWAATPATGANAPEAVEESSDGGKTWQLRPGLPAGSYVLSLTLSGDGRTVYALTSGGQVYEAQKGLWYLLSTGLQLGAPPG